MQNFGKSFPARLMHKAKLDNQLVYIYTLLVNVYT